MSDTSVGASPPLTPDPTSDPCKFLIKDHHDDDQALIYGLQWVNSNFHGLLRINQSRVDNIASQEWIEDEQIGSG